MEFKTETPTLVFDGLSAVEADELPATTTNEIKEEIVLSEEEKAQVEAFAKQIDLSNSTAILNYGAGTQKKLSDFSEKALDSIRTKDMGEVGDMITKLIGELKDFDAAEEEKGLKALFKKSSNRLTAMKAKYAKVSRPVSRCCHPPSTNCWEPASRRTWSPRSSRKSWLSRRSTGFLT